MIENRNEKLEYEHYEVQHYTDVVNRKYLCQRHVGKRLTIKIACISEGMRRAVANLKCLFIFIDF